MQLLVDGVHRPVADVQVIDDNRVKCDTRVEYPILRNPERVLRFVECHVAGDAEREDFDARRILLVSVDDLVRVMLFQIALGDDVSKQQPLLMHDGVQIVAERKQMLFALKCSKVFIQFLYTVDLIKYTVQIVGCLLGHGCLRSMLLRGRMAFAATGIVLRVFDLCAEL